ncbi:hypothetical protein Ahy_B02g058837 [Arachis hypogaea]|uniref:TF-B3 domain-containing protein n=1 Tax=Arachis hypogaea TaxID=3818 RepID=A0A445AFI8_ARAHY|nr:hypothetical protein Ahy_B02g058837 [Arachis hypogaea]
MDAGRRRLPHALGHIGRNNDVVRVIKPAGDPLRPVHIPFPNDLLPKSSKHVYLTVSNGVQRTYKIGCSPNVLGEITLEGGWERFYCDYKLRPNDILLLNHKGLDDFDVRIFKSPGVERSYVLSGGESSNRRTPQVPNTPPLHQPRMGCIKILRSAAGSEVAQTFRSDHPFFVMHITRRLLGVHFLVSLVLVIFVSSSLSTLYTYYIGNVGPHYMCCFYVGGYVVIVRLCRVGIVHVCVLCW